MIAISDKLKNAITSTEREVKSFAILSDIDDNELPSYVLDIDEGFKNHAEICNITSIKDISSNIPYRTNYASLERDYFLLDGTFILPTRTGTNTNTGYIGQVANTIDVGYDTTPFDEIVILPPVYKTVDDIDYYSDEDLAEWKDIHDNYLKRDDGCITVYFGNGEVPAYVQATFYKGEKVTIDDEEVWTLTGNNVTSVKTYMLNKDTDYVTLFQNDTGSAYASDTTIGLKISLYYYSTDTEKILWNNKNHRIRIRDIIWGENKTLDNEDIINMNIHEQTSLYNREVPANDFSMTVGNYDHYFDVDNDNGFYSWINEYWKANPVYPDDYRVNNLKIKIFIGFVLDNGTIEYIPSGMYKYSNFKNSENLTTTINFKGLVDRITDTGFYYDDETNTTDNPKETLKLMLEQEGIIQDTDYIDFKYTDAISHNIINSSSYKDQFQQFLISRGGIYKQRRDTDMFEIMNSEDITYKITVPSKLVGSLTLTEQTSYPKVEINNKLINKFALTYDSINFASLGNVEEVITVNNPKFIERQSIGNYVYYYYELEATTAPFKNSGNKSDWGSPSSNKDNRLGIYRNNLTLDTYIDEIYTPKNSPYYIRIKFHTINGECTKAVVFGKKYQHSNSTQEIISSNYTYYDGEKVNINSNLSSNSNSLTLLSHILYNSSNNRNAYQHPYKVEVKYMGNPSFEVGDWVNIQTALGSLNLLIEELTLTYDGGLQGTLKGVATDYGA